MKLSMITGASYLDDRMKGICNLHYKAQSTYIVRTYQCCCFVLCSTRLLNNMFCPLEQWTVCDGRLGNSAIETCQRKSLIPDQLDRPDHFNCLLDGIYSHHDLSKQSILQLDYW
jgi:hypothetical protein